ncbi:MAG: DUF4249 domain-containing protein [Bacteroidota bacterium]
MDRIRKHINYWLWARRAMLSVFTLGMVSCVESFEIPTNTAFDNVLIVEGSITNAMGTQRISLTRTGPLGTTEVTPEQNATVQILASNGSTFSFQESQPGIYESNDAFAATEGVSYSLSIASTDGNVYTSTPQTISGTAELEEVVARRIVNDDNIEGVEIVVNASDPTGQAKFFRYSFEETYLIIAPRWNQFEAFVVSQNPPEVDIKPRTQEELFCYGTNVSQTSTLFSTAEQSGSRIEELPVHFLAKDDYFIAHRYSILVKQNVQSEAAFRYYQTLRELSGQENLLSQQQPGFLAGNILVNGNSSRVATGYFEIVSQTEKRIFFDFEDLFDPVGIPAYAVGCDNFLEPFLPIDEFGNSQLILDIESGNLEFFNDNFLPSGAPDLERPFKMVPRICGDCTVLGSNIKPDFWID